MMWLAKLLMRIASALVRREEQAQRKRRRPF